MHQRSCAVSLDAVILTKDEAANLPACLESLQPWAARVFVVDSGSTDGTIEIARRYGAVVLHHQYESPAHQWNWAFRNVPFTSEWALCLDADHRVTPELREELALLFGDGAAPPDDVDGFYMVRRQIFRGRPIRHGGYRRKPMLKLVRHRTAHSDEHERLDFRLYVPGKTRLLRGALIEDNTREHDIAFWLHKHVRYARIQSGEELARDRNGSPWSVPPALGGTPDQRVLWLKQRWYRMPLYVRPFLYFFYRYVICLGFLDGREGLIFHFLHAFWYRFVVDVMVDDGRGVARVNPE